MNVAFDRWIPVVTTDGTKQLASLCEVMTEGEAFADLAVRPHERVSLMRLFLCVAHAALDGPRDYDEWCEVPSRLPEAAHHYLEEWKDSFELFHPRKPWLQVATIAKQPNVMTPRLDDWTPVSKLGFFLATGANTTLFDHAGMNNEQRHITLANTLLSMVAFQCFSTGGLISQVYWNGVQTGKSSKDGPCCPASMMHALLRGKELLTSIHLNLPSFEHVRRSYSDCQTGRPVWENPPASFQDQEAIANATETYVGRLLPMCRLIRLHETGQCMLLGDGLVYRPFADGFPPEPTATVVIKTKDKKQERALLSFRPAKAMWRELGSVLAKRGAEQIGGPLSLAAIQDGQGCDLVTCALARDQATIVDTAESVYHIPPQLRSDDGTAVYEREVQVAENMARQLGWAIDEYRRAVDGGWEGRLKSAGPSKVELTMKLHSCASTNYWTSIEKQLGLLIDCVEAIGSDEALTKRDTWRRMIFGTALDVFRTICGQETPRQMKAFAAGWERLTRKPKNSATETVDIEENAS